MHLAVGIFGDMEFFSKFGKIGTVNDLAIRNQSDSNNVITYVTPNSDKIQPLLQAAAIADYYVIIVNEITPSIGELFILLDEMKVLHGLIVTDFLEDKIRTMTKDMSIESFNFAKKDEQMVREKILATNIERPNSPLHMIVDSYFSVKGVGTVALGFVKSGRVKQYDKLVIYPIKKEILVKSIQSQDNDVKEAEHGQRIGIAVKGVNTDELKRGFIFSDSKITCGKSLIIEVEKNKFSKFELSPGRKLMVNIGLQVVTAEIKNISTNRVELTLDNYVAVYKNRCILATTDVSPRIIGSGKIIDI